MNISVSYGSPVVTNTQDGRTETAVIIRGDAIDGAERREAKLQWPGCFTELERVALEYALQHLLDDLGVITQSEYEDRVKILGSHIDALHDQVREEKARANKAEKNAEDIRSVIDEYGLSAFMTLDDKINEAKRTADRLDRAYAELRRGVDLALSREV